LGFDSSELTVEVGEPCFGRLAWDRCYDFFKYFRPKFSNKNWRFFAQTTASFCKNLIMTLILEKNANFFSNLLANIAKQL
jgi:hypothetical protein